LTIPLARRVTGYRLVARTDQLAAGVLTRWDVDLHAAPPGSPTPPARPARRPLRAAATVIVLAGAPTCQSAGFAAGERSRVWMDPGRAPFDVTITLPGTPAYHARAEMAVMLSSNPRRRRRPAHGPAPARQPERHAWLVGHYAARWGFPAEASRPGMRGLR
jgi:hypothetical protein